MAGTGTIKGSRWLKLIFGQQCVIGGIRGGWWGQHNMVPLYCSGREIHLAAVEASKT